MLLHQGLRLAGLTLLKRLQRPGLGRLVLLQCLNWGCAEKSMAHASSHKNLLSPRRRQSQTCH
eukprot:3053532-Lingulodinium_polyedra.AAC.1